MQANEFEQTFMAFKTVLEMVEDRSYFIPQNLLQFSEQDFQEKYQQFTQDNGMLFIFDHKN